MTSAGKPKRTTRTAKPASPSERPAGPARIAETFVLLDNSSGKGPPSLLFTDPVETVSANNPNDVDNALVRIEAGVARGLHAAGFFSYELGYVLEPKLRPLMPEGRNVPLLWFGLYKKPVAMSESA